MRLQTSGRRGYPEIPRCRERNANSWIHHSRSVIAGSLQRLIRGKRCKGLCPAYDPELDRSGFARAEHYFEHLPALDGLGTCGTKRQKLDRSVWALTPRTAGELVDVEVFLGVGQSGPGLSGADRYLLVRPKPQIQNARLGFILLRRVVDQQRDLGESSVRVLLIHDLQLQVAVFAVLRVQAVPFHTGLTVPTRPAVLAADLTAHRPGGFTGISALSDFYARAFGVAGFAVGTGASASTTITATRRFAFGLTKALSRGARLSTRASAALLAAQVATNPSGALARAVALRRLHETSVRIRDSRVEARACPAASVGSAATVRALRVADATSIDTCFVCLARRARCIGDALMVGARVTRLALAWATAAIVDTALVSTDRCASGCTGRSQVCSGGLARRGTMGGVTIRITSDRNK